MTRHASCAAMLPAGIMVAAEKYLLTKQCEKHTPDDNRHVDGGQQERQSAGGATKHEALHTSQIGSRKFCTLYMAGNCGLQICAQK